MFRNNKQHLQGRLISDLDLLTEKSRTRLEQSWAGVFRREFFYRLDETLFAVLYSSEPSRPNIPVNVLVGLECLKADSNWSDEDMHDAFLFDMQVRYALGYENLGEGEFDLRTVYNFRRRLSNHMGKTGEDLVEKAFEQITDEQIAAYQLKTGRLRMDSTQISSNIRRMTRLQLLVEVLQRVHRMLDEEDKTRYAEVFAPYMRGSSGQYVYHLKGEQTEQHLLRIGELMARLLIELAQDYASKETYHILERVFHEQFVLNENAAQDKLDDKPSGWPSDDPSRSDVGDPGDDGAAEVLCVQVRPGKEISPSSLCSPDDPDATYRKKGQQEYEGYATNITDTCDRENPFQLIVKVQTEPNLTEDPDFLMEALPNLQQRTNLNTLYNDGGFCSPDVDILLREAHIDQVPTALRGKKPDPNRTTLTDFEFHFDNQERLTHMICPHGHTASVKPGRTQERYIAHLTDDPCDECRFHKSDNSSDTKPKAKTRLYFTQADLDRALRRQRSQAYHLDEFSYRAAIEAVMGAVKRPFGNDQTPVRGKFRMSNMMVGSSVMVNIRRIQRYLAKKNKPNKLIQEEKHPKKCENNDTSQLEVSFLSMFRSCFQRFLRPFSCQPVALLFSF